MTDEIDYESFDGPEPATASALDRSGPRYPGRVVDGRSWEEYFRTRAKNARTEKEAAERLAAEPLFTVSAHSVEIDPAQLPRAARSFHKRMAASGYAVRCQMNLTRHRATTFVGTDKAGQVKTPEHIVEHFGVQCVKWLADGSVGIAVQAHWGEGFEGGYFWTSATGREFLITWSDLAGYLDIIAPKPEVKKKAVKEAA